MKKVIKNMFMIFMILSIIIVSSDVFAASSLGNGLDKTLLDDVTKNDTTLSGKFDKTIGNVYATLFTIMKVLGIAGVVIQGIRYMYAQGDSKAKIKQSLIYIIIGVIFIFGAELIADKISAAFQEISK